MNTERRDTQERLTYRIMATKSKKEENKWETMLSLFYQFPSFGFGILNCWLYSARRWSDSVYWNVTSFKHPPPPPNRPIDIVLFRADQHKPEIILLQQKIDLHWYNKPNLIFDFHNRMHNFHEFNFHILEVRCRLKY